MIRYYKVGMGCKREDITAGGISGRVELFAENMIKIAIWRLMHVYLKRLAHASNCYGQMVRRKKTGNCGGAFEGRLRGVKSRKEEEEK